MRSKVGRKTAGSRKSRKSASAPPQLLPSPPGSLNVLRNSHVSPPQSTFDPQLPALERLPAPKFIRAPPINYSSPLRAAEPKTEESDDELNLVGDPTEVTGTAEDGLTTVKEEEQDAEDGCNADISVHQSIAVSQRIAGGADGVSKPVVSRRRHNASSRILQLLYTAVVLAICGVGLNYKIESTSIGYCDRGSNTNNYLEALRGRRSAVESCNRENRTLLYLPPLSSHSASEGTTDLTPCPLPPLLPLPQPDSCTPCPDHATCSQTSVICDVGYLLRVHPLLSFLPASASARNAKWSLSSSPVDLIWKVLSITLDGLPGFGSVALPPRCVEDPKRKRNIGALGKAIESLLGQERGVRLCAGGKAMDKVVMDADGGEAKKWGVEIEKLRETMKKKTPVSFEQ